MLLNIKTAMKFAEVLEVDVSQIVWELDEKVEPDLAALPEMPKHASHDPRNNVSIVTDEQLAVARQWLAAGVSNSATAQAMGMSRTTFYKVLTREAGEAEVKKAKKRRGESEAHQKPRKAPASRKAKRNPQRQGEGHQEALCEA